MPIIVPLVLLAAVGLALLVLTEEVTRRHLAGMAFERSFRAGDDVAVAPTVAGRHVRTTAPERARTAVRGRARVRHANRSAA